MAQQVQALPSRLRQAGVYYSQPVFVPPEATSVQVLADNRAGWTDVGPGETVLELTMEIDQRGTWETLGACTADATPKAEKGDQVAAQTAVRCRLPRGRVPQPQVRAVLRCMSPCTGGLALQFDEAPLPGLETQAHHSVTYGTDNESTALNATSITLASFVVANNANRCLLVGVCGYDTTASQNVVSSVTWNGSGTGAASVISRLLSDGGSGGDRSSIWRVLDPTPTTASIVVNFAGTANEIGLHVLSVYDVDQTTPTAGGTGADGLSGTITVNVSAATGDLVYDLVYSGASSASVPAVGASQTQRASNVITGNVYRLASTEPGAATVTMSWTRTNQEDWCQVACAIKASAVVGPYTPKAVVMTQAVHRAALW